MQWVSPWGWDGLGWRILGPSESDLGALALPRWAKPPEGCGCLKWGCVWALESHLQTPEKTYQARERQCPRGDCS